MFPKRRVRLILLFKPVAFVFFSAECTDNANTRQVFLCHGGEFALVFVTFEKACAYFSVKQERIADYHGHGHKRNDRKQRVHREHKHH